MNKFQKQPEPQPQQMSQEEQMQLIAQEVENLQNNGLFRLKLLGSLEKQTQSLKELNQTIIDLGTEILPRIEAISSSVPEEEDNEVKVEDADDFELPPMPPKKK